MYIALLLMALKDVVMIAEWKGSRKIEQSRFRMMSNMKFENRVISQKYSMKNPEHENSTVLLWNPYLTWKYTQPQSMLGLLLPVCREQGCRAKGLLRGGQTGLCGRRK